MDKTLQSISDHLSKNTRVEIYSSYNQHLVDNENIVLWDKTAASISPEVYTKFKEAVSKRVCPWYTLNKILPYYDFCIALLCSVGYSLNHNTMPAVNVRTFRSTWRTIPILTAITDKDVQDWIKDRIQDRDSIKYSAALGIAEAESPSIPHRVSLSKGSNKFIIDEDVISKACSSRNVREIQPDGSVPVSTVLHKVTGSPECQLDSLRIIHSELINGYF